MRKLCWSVIPPGQWLFWVYAQYLHQQIGGDLIVLSKQKHFSLSTYGEKYRRFPYLFHLIARDALYPNDVLELYQTLEKKDVMIWLDGGWGVDALLESQSRPHADLDIAIQKKDIKTLNQLLAKRGYREILRSDTSLKNYMLGNDRAQLIDVHVIELDKAGNGIYGPAEDKVMYPATALTGLGKIEGYEVRCISPEWVVKFHSGYKPRKVDLQDVKAVCEKFGIEIPAEYV